MNTTYILHGGNLRFENELNDSFFREFVRDLKDEDQVLHIGFAREDRENRQHIFERDTALMRAQTDRSILVVSAELETLPEQIAASRAIFITGGSTESLIRDIRSCEQFVGAIAGKLVAGSSAGAYLLARYGTGHRGSAVYEGLGLVPVRLVCHYESTDRAPHPEAYAALEQMAPELELVLLRDCEWRIFKT